MIMNYKIQTELVNTLKKIARSGADQLNTEKTKSVRSFGFGDYGIRFVGSEDIEVFKETIIKMMQIHELDKAITLKSFTNRLIELLGELIWGNLDCNENDIEIFYKLFLEQKYIEFEIVGPIYGIQMDTNEYTLGDFKIYNLSFLKEILRSRRGYIKELETMYYGNIDSEYVVGIKVRARQQEKAVEIANQYLGIFENVLNYVVSDTSHTICPGVFNYKGHRVRSSLAISEIGVGSNNEATSISLPFEINDKNCKSSAIGNDLLWPLITKSNKNNLEKRILNAVDWIGKAIYEVDPAKAVTEYIFAIEGLLLLNEGSFISSSIVSQISDWAAFIIYDNLEDRKKLAKRFKEIYQKRSAVSHGGKTNISSDDLFKAYAICKQLIIILLVNVDFKGMSKIEDIRDWVESKKFS